MSPYISVVVPTFNRKELLPKLLKSLLQQNFQSSEYEIIVVNDGSSDGTDKLLERIQQEELNKGRYFSFYNQPNSGPAAARNLGISKAKGEIVAFTDDDCIAHPNWLLAVKESFQLDQHLDIVQGKTVTDLKKTNLFTHQIHRTELYYALPTCNVAYKRKILNTIGGFDTNFPHPHGEDTDLSFNAMKLASRIKFNSEMEIYHPPRVETFKKLSKRWKMLESEFLLYHKHPNLYVKYISPNPWITIYGNIFIKVQWYHIKQSIKQWRNPKLMFRSLMLVGAWWINLLSNYSKYKSAEEKFNKI